jgi:hypothetical protein
MSKLKQYCRGIAVSGDLVRAETVAHHLRLFGYPAAGVLVGRDPLVIDRPLLGDVDAVRRALALGISVVAVLPDQEFAEAFNVSLAGRLDEVPCLFRSAPSSPEKSRRLRTLFASRIYTGSATIPVVEDAQSQRIWLYQPVGPVGIFFIGTDLPADLVRYRQGDPLASLHRPTEPMWGIPGERPNYLFEGQLAGERQEERHADWWCETLAVALKEIAKQPRLPILPGGAPGAVVITGDDDQATISSYEQQSVMLGSLPITYFLHPLTKHNRQTMDRISAGRRVEYELHPDALEKPECYADLLSEQSAWFRRLTGFRPRAVRNHGFLNDGYWGHAASWLRHGILASSNLPGVDGRVINGSLLPARLSLDSGLTAHWSILTAIGDGAVFLNDWDDRQSADCVHRMAQLIRASGIPGVIVLNLHPQNVERTGGMHQAARDIVADGFLAWTFSECIAWFSFRDENRSWNDPMTRAQENFVLRCYQQIKSVVKSASERFVIGAQVK